MNGPFEISRDRTIVIDDSGAVVARGDSQDGDEVKERENAAMVCAALNAVYYAAKAAGSAA